MANHPPCPTALLAGAGHGQPPGRAGPSPAREHQAGRKDCSLQDTQAAASSRAEEDAELQGAEQKGGKDVSSLPVKNQESVLSLCLSLCHGQTYSLQERLQELSSLAQHWQQLHLDSERTLALREEELVVCKVELAFLKEELSKVTVQMQNTNRHSRHTGQDAGGEPVPNVQST